MNRCDLEGLGLALRCFNASFPIWALTSINLRRHS